MARTSRYADKIKVKGLDIALYVRLSEEDFHKKDESVSIKNQKAMLEKYIQSLPNVNSYKFYVDDGYTGGNFDRPDFKTMIADIIDKKINCVVVKDFSRLGRDYLGVANYYQIIFPALRVRAISVNDNYDSDINFDRLEDILSMDLKNVLNEQYLKDCSIKAKISYQQRRNRGLFTSPVAPYGYKRKDDDKHKLEIDYEVADNVKFIFQDYIEKQSYRQVMKDLIDKKILSPSAYKQTKPQSYYTNKVTTNPYIWSMDSVRAILTNIYYLGHTAQHRREIIDYKTKKCVKLPKEEWIIVENTHEPLIDKETFDIVQNIIKSRENKFFNGSKQENTDNYFAGLIYCGKCNGRMTYSNDKNAKHSFYKCKLKQKDTRLCEQKSIKTQQITKVVFYTIKHLIDIACDMDKTIKEINKYEDNLEKLNNITQQKRNLKLNSFEIEKENLYYAYRSGDISLKDYTTRKQELEKQYNQVAISQTLLVNKKSQIFENEFIKMFKQYKSLKSLSKEIVASLINKIVVYDHDKIEIDFKFKDEYESAVAYIRENALKIAT